MSVERSLATIQSHDYETNPVYRVVGPLLLLMTWAVGLPIAYCGSYGSRPSFHNNKQQFEATVSRALRHVGHRERPTGHGRGRLLDDVRDYAPKPAAEEGDRTATNPTLSGR